VATNSCSVTTWSLKLSNVEPISTWMGDHQGRVSAVNLCPFVCVDLNMWPTVHIAVIWTKIDRSTKSSAEFRFCSADLLQ